MKAITIHSHAKINLTLAVLSRRTDGYHTIVSVMQPLALADTVSCQAAEKTELQIKGADLPLDERNIAYRAWRLLQKEYSLPDGLLIHIQKRIPVAAGLAGGSGNAAAVLKAVNAFYHLGLSLADLAVYGKTLGADIPFCLYEKTALATGIGEQIMPMPKLPAYHVVLVNPGFAVSTQEIYDQYDALSALPAIPDTAAMTAAILQKDFQAVGQSLGNMLEAVVLTRYPQLRVLKQEMSDLGLFALLSGSGPTVYGLAPTMEKARHAAQFLQKKYPLVLETQFWAGE